MKRLFSNFPSGWPGVGLLLLRLACAIGLAAEGNGLIAAVGRGAMGGSGIATPGLGALLILCGGLVAAGFLTPAVQTLVIVIELGGSGQQLWAVGFATVTQYALQARIFEAMVAASLVLLGPGAYSIDAHLFGREEIVIPPRRHPSTVPPVTTIPDSYPESGTAPQGSLVVGRTYSKW